MSKNLTIFSLIILPYLAGAVVLSNLTTGCTAITQTQALSTSKAQRMVDKWGNSKGSIQVMGVREDSNSSAVATLQVSNLKFLVDNYFTKGQKQVNYSGPGQAKFSRYTDGTWVLTYLEFNKGDGDLQNAFVIKDLNIKDN
ncbi:hypothetical protein QUB05_21820 [Microcoleus sp. F10-C6]|uniref:hypothetical protein n=1 Tax=unclassified Microcoleus TaxID=2642155 RepID=UPI002FD03E03